VEDECTSKLHEMNVRNMVIVHFDLMIHIFSLHFDTFKKIPHMMIPSNNGTWQCLCNMVVMHNLCLNLAKYSILKQVAYSHVNYNWYNFYIDHCSNYMIGDEHFMMMKG